MSEREAMSLTPLQARFLLLDKNGIELLCGRHYQLKREVRGDVGDARQSLSTKIGDYFKKLRKRFTGTEERA